MARCGNCTPSMAALPVGALPLPVPETSPTKFSFLFADASRDPAGGSWDAMMASFLQDAHKTNANTDTDMLYEMVTASGVRNELPYFAVAHRNRARLYSIFMRW